MTSHCKFCQKDNVYVPLIIKGGNGSSKYHTFEVYYCYDCAAEYVNYGENSVHLYTTLNDKMYRWSVNMIAGQPDYGTIWYVGEPGEPGVRPNKKMKLLKSFTDNLPQVTPKNIQSKLRFMLLFL